MKFSYNKDAFRNGALCHNCFAPLDISETDDNGACVCKYCNSTWLIKEVGEGYSVYEGRIEDGHTFVSASSCGFYYGPYGVARITEYKGGAKLVLDELPE